LLVDALNRYEGSYILVSHDRYFISKTANKIWEIVDHEIKEFKGGYEEYVEWKERMSAKPEVRSKKPEARDQKPQEKPVAKEPLKEKSTKSVPESEKTAIKKELQKQQKTFQQLEKKVAELTQQKEALEISLASPEVYSNGEEFKKTEASYKDVLNKLGVANKEYEKVFEKIIELDEELLK